MNLGRKSAVQGGSGAVDATDLRARRSPPRGLMRCHPCANWGYERVHKTVGGGVGKRRGLTCPTRPPTCGTPIPWRHADLHQLPMPPTAIGKRVRPLPATRGRVRTQPSGGAGFRKHRRPLRVPRRARTRAKGAKARAAHDGRDALANRPRGVGRRSGLLDGGNKRVHCLGKELGGLYTHTHIVCLETLRAPHAVRNAGAMLKSSSSGWPARAAGPPALRAVRPNGRPLVATDEPSSPHYLRRSKLIHAYPERARER